MNIVNKKNDTDTQDALASVRRPLTETETEMEMITRGLTSQQKATIVGGVLVGALGAGFGWLVGEL